MTVIKGHTGKGQLIALNFMQDAVAASQSDVQLMVAEVASAANLGVDAVEMPWEGEIVGISYALSAASTAGTLTVGATINGSEDASTTKSVTTTQRDTKRVSRGDAKFNASDYLGVEISTTSGWTATTADLLVTLWVLVYLEGV
jgi:hypothetical protein